jgi:signal peptidase I
MNPLNTDIGAEVETQPEPTPAVPPAPPAHGSWMTSVQSLAMTVVIAVFVITFLVQAFQIPSESMENTLLIGDYLLVDKVHYGHPGFWGEILPYTQIKRGDIIVFRYPVRPSQHFVKRVVGVPGDRVRLQNKVVYVNGQRVREDYVVYKAMMADHYRDDFPDLQAAAPDVTSRWWEKLQTLVHNGELTVPAGSYFVMGDNRDKSLDSRYWGFVPRENIIGRPLVIYWSMRTEEAETSPNMPDDKLGRFVYMMTHVMQETRWDRTLRIVK